MRRRSIWGLGWGGSRVGGFEAAGTMVCSCGKGGDSELQSMSKGSWRWRWNCSRE